MTAAFRFEVKAKGRIVLPAALRELCGFAEGTELIARPLGRGRFVVETQDAVLERIWDACPEPAPDAVADLEAWRTASGVDRWNVLASVPDDDGNSAERSAATLAALGL